MSWPRCSATSTLLGVDHVLECVLPDGHLLDGEQMHENGEGVQWVFTLTNDDGTEVRR